MTDDDRRYDLLRIPRGTVAASRIGRQRAGVIVPDEIRKGVRGSYSRHPIYGMIELNAGSAILCQQSIEDLHHRDGVQVYFFRHSEHNPTPELSASYLWPNDDDLFTTMIAYLFGAGLNFFLQPGYILPRRLDLIDPGHGRIDYQRLAFRLARCAPDSYDGRAECATEKLLDSAVERQLFRVYKAGTLSYQAHVTGDGAALVAASNICRRAQEWDPDSITLLAFDMLLHEAQSEHKEVIVLRDRAVQLLEKEVGEEFIERQGCGSHFEFYMRTYYMPLYYERWRSDFAYRLYERYQST